METDKSQLDKFEEVACVLETDDKVRFNGRMGNIVKYKPVDKPE